MAAVTLASARPALASAPQIKFHIEPKPISEALLDVAQQANVTLVGAGACPGAMELRIAAPMTLAQALDRVLGDAPPRAGDLVFWPGHVAFAIEDGNILHANAHHMAVAVEPLATMVERVGPAVEVRRLG